MWVGVVYPYDRYRAEYSLNAYTYTISHTNIYKYMYIYWNFAIPQQQQQSLRLPMFCYWLQLVHDKATTTTTTKKHCGKIIVAIGATRCIYIIYVYVQWVFTRYQIVWIISISRISWKSLTFIVAKRVIKVQPKEYQNRLFVGNVFD